VKKTTTYRDLVDELIEMPRIRDALDLDSIPAPSTLCKAFDRLEMAVWRVLLNISLADVPLNGVTGIDAAGFERAHASTHYTKRANLTIQQLKTTLLVDTAANAVPDIHVTTTRKHDTQIAPQVVKRNTASIAVLTGDKGYDDQMLGGSPGITIFDHSSSIVSSPHSTRRGMHAWTPISAIGGT
jgi:IS5 family transposase